MNYIIEHSEFIAWLFAGVGGVWTFMGKERRRWLLLKLSRNKEATELEADAEANRAKGNESINDQLDKMRIRLAQFAEENNDVYELLSSERKESSQKSDYINRLETAIRKISTMCQEFCPQEDFCKKKIQDTLIALKINVGNNEA